MRPMNQIMRAIIVLWLFLLAGSAHAQTGKPDFERIFKEHGVVMLLIEPASGQIVDANPAAARYYGYSQEVLRSMSIQQINTFTPAQVAAERKLAESEGRNYFIFRHRLANNEIRTVGVHSNPFEFEGRKLLLSIINDITPGRHAAQDLWHYQQRLEEMVDAQVRQIEQTRRQQLLLLLLAVVAQMAVIVWLVINIQRRRRLQHERESLLQTLRERNEELSRLGEVMAHHFQEPTRRLVSFARRLQDKPALSADADSKLSLEFIDSQAQRLSELVRDAQRYLALDHAKVGAGGTAESAAELRQSIAEAGLPGAETEVGVEVVLHEPLPTVRIAGKYLRELFAILLDNAWRYRRSDRPLQIEVSATVAAGRAILRFADNGSGIAPEYREQVMGLFTRLVPNSIPGTGMGLALATKIVKLAGGSLRVEDGIAGGTCIVIDLPLENTA